MPFETQISGGPFPIGATITYTGRIVDENGAGIPAANLTTLRLTLQVRSTGQILNGINYVNILNAGRGTVDSSGNVVVTLAPADTTTTSVPNLTEYEASMFFDFTFAAGAKTGRHQASFMLIVPAA